MGAKPLVLRRSKSSGSADAVHALSSGPYFYRLQVGDTFLNTKKVLLLK